MAPLEYLQASPINLVTEKEDQFGRPTASATVNLKYVCIFEIDQMKTDNIHSFSAKDL